MSQNRQDGRDARVLIDLDDDDPYRISSMDGNNPHPRVPLPLRCPVLKYRKDIPIQRFGRKWDHFEVLGFFYLALEIILLAALAVIRLEAVGYFEGLMEDPQYPLTFTWKSLWEYFYAAPLPEQLSACLFDYSGKGPVRVAQEEADFDKANITYHGASVHVLWTLFASHWQTHTEIGATSKQVEHEGAVADKHLCIFKGPSALGWLLKFLLAQNILPVLIILTSTVLFTSVSVRRIRWVRIWAVAISNICWIVSLYHFFGTNTNVFFTEGRIWKEMHRTLMHSNPPLNIVPILDDTQTHYQCCGLDSPRSWDLFGDNKYPPSCCNYKAFNCSGLEPLTQNHVWNRGCFEAVVEKIDSFELWSCILFEGKCIPEAGISLSIMKILSRHVYIPPAIRESSCCEIKGYTVKSKGAMHIKGVTKDDRVVVETESMFLLNYNFKKSNLRNGICVKFMRNNMLKGSVEVVKRFNVENYTRNDIQVAPYLSNLKMKISLIFSLQ